VSLVVPGVPAVLRDDIAGYVSTVFYVYLIILLAYLLSNMYFSFGGRVPYNRWLSAAIGFLREVSEPYLSIFRRLIPQFGPFDFSPILAILVLSIGGRIITNLIAG
jgi:YggT family protein